MKIAAILTLVLAILTGIWVIADYSQNERNRSRHGTEALGSLSDYSIAQLDRDNDLERQDGFVGVAAIGFFIASLVMFSKTKNSLPLSRCLISESGAVALALWPGLALVASARTGATCPSHYRILLCSPLARERVPCGFYLICESS